EQVGAMEQLGEPIDQAEQLDVFPGDGIRMIDGEPGGHDLVGHSVHGRKTRAVFWPPNPNELLSAAWTSRRVATSGVRSSPSAPGSGSVRLMVGGMHPSRIVRTVAIASMAPAAPRVWPTIDLLAVIGICPARSPKIVRIAWSSALSPSGVEVA